jgi:anti-anti-sigma factor
LERHGDNAVVRPAGELDHDTAPQLDRALNAVQAPDRNVVLDVRGIGTIDSAGVRTIVAALDRAARMGGTLGVISGDVVRRQFGAAGLADRLAAAELPDDQSH